MCGESPENRKKRKGPRPQPAMPSPAAMPNPAARPSLATRPSPAQPARPSPACQPLWRPGPDPTGINILYNIIDRARWSQALSKK